MNRWLILIATSLLTPVTDHRAVLLIQSPAPGFITISNREQIALMSYNQFITLPVNPKVNIVPNQCNPQKVISRPKDRKLGGHTHVLVFYKYRGEEWNQLHIRVFYWSWLNGVVFTICVSLIQYLSGSDKFARQQPDGLGPDKYSIVYL